MPWTGSVYIRDNGVFTGPLVWTDDRDAGTKITAAHHDTHDQDIADGITACLNKNGANQATADINFGGFNLLNVAEGVNPTDGANTSQTITAASLDPVTNELTLSRDAGDVTVDLTSLVIGGSTANFAKLNTPNTFTNGPNVFNAVQVTEGNGYRWNSGAGSILQWEAYRDNVGWYLLRNGAEFLRVPNAGSDFYAAGYKVWTAYNLDPSGFLSASANETITGSWTFYNAGGITLPTITIFGGGTNSYTADTNSAGKFYIYGNFSSAIMYMDYDATEKTRLYTDNKRVWNQGNLQVLTAAPTGGVDGDLAVVISGADRGLWTKTGGLWTVLITFP